MLEFAAMCGARCDIDDASAAVGTHVADGEPREIGRAEYIDIEGAAPARSPRVERSAVERVGREDRGVIHEHVQSAESSHAGVYESRQARGIRHVAASASRAVAKL